MAGALSMVVGADQRIGITRAREAATNVQRELVERVRSIPYTQLTQGSIYAQLQALPGLEDASAAAGYQLRRRGDLYTLALSVCTRDDPRDGLGPHAAGLFCAGEAAGTTDGNPDDYKLVTVDVAWSGRQSRQQAVINNPGNAAGPAVCDLALNAGVNGVITSVLGAVTVSLCISFAPVTVSWSVDGAVQGTAGGSGTNWSFVWPISALFDGTYQVGARAFDAAGVSGPGRSLTVTLNRFVPLAPVGLAAGRNGGVVDAEWLANKERDIVGYTLYRGATQVASCAQTTDTACQDTAPPNLPLLTYTLVALDRDPNSGALRQGVASAPVTVTQLNTRPNTPTALSASTNADGATVLTWSAPVPADPNLGDSIAFYRIYRDGTAVSNRFDRTGLGTQTSYVDGHSGGSAHTYWVTAVDTQLAESLMAGPVTR
jgi:hypothetical protein